MGKKQYIIFAVIIFFTNIYSIENRTNERSDYSNTQKSKSDQGFALTFRTIFYYHNCDVYEQTGNEDSFAANFHAGFAYKKEIANSSVESRIGLSLYEQLSKKARFYEEMNPPGLEIERLDIIARLGEHHIFSMGIIPPLVYTLELPLLFSPVMFSRNIPSAYYHMTTVLFNEKDVPLSYAIKIPKRDTGIMYTLKISGFKCSIGIFNGEEGLDANSAKTAAYDIGFENTFLTTGLAGQIGNKGSVPIKEWNHIYSYYFYIGRSIRFGFETSLFVHGIRNRTIDPRDGELLEYLKERYGYSDLFFSTDALLSVTNPGEPVFGFSSLLYMYIKQLLLKDLSLHMHISIYDPDIENEEKYYWCKYKYRGSARFTYTIIKNFSFVLSETFTYDHVFYRYEQFYEVEPRSIHYQLDNDIFAGFLFEFII
ncbi:hypothetical protein ACFL6D_02425 [Spirochaetota bacterium]